MFSGLILIATPRKGPWKLYWGLNQDGRPEGRAAADLCSSYKFLLLNMTSLSLAGGKLAEAQGLAPHQPREVSAQFSSTLFSI